MRTRRPKPLRAKVPNPDEYLLTGDQESDGPIVKLRGHCPVTCAAIETVDILIKADEIDYNRDTEYAEARGQVYYENFNEGEKMFADKAEYQVDQQEGKFYNVHGTSPRQSRRTPWPVDNQQSFYFEGAWAEKIKKKD